MESDRYHQHSKYRPAKALAYSAWPVEWLTIYYKDYEHLPKVVLPRTPLPPADLGGTIATRMSGRDVNQSSLPLEQLSWLLRYSCGIQDGPHKSSGPGRPTIHRAQPSGGGRYPVEAYLLNFVGGALPAGTYHYNVKEHSLDVLEKRDFSEKDINSLFIYDWIARAPAAIVLTGVFPRSQGKYGERGYRYTLLEAGHIAQNIVLVAGALGLQSCPMTGTKDSAQEKNLDVDGVTESVLHSVILST